MSAARTVLLALAASVFLSTSADAALTAGQRCENAVSDALRACVSQVSRLQQQCYRKTGSACAASDARLAKQLDRVASQILKRCPDQATVQAGGYGPVLTPNGLVQRIQNACTQAVASLAARSYGGPHAAVRAEVFPSEQKCLDFAWREGASLLVHDLKQQSSCVRNARAGKSCNTGVVASRLATKASKTAAKLARKCVTPLAQLVGLEPTDFTARAAEQARCLVASAHGDTAPLSLDCGPRASVPVPARGVATKVVLPSNVWGTRCGNGSDYAFDLRLAPVGAPVERIVVHLQGGGVCLGAADCPGVNPGLFEALGDSLPNGGIMSSTAATNPFRDWTKVSLPYCTQDLHIGGGTTNVFPDITVHRYGALNVRAALRYVRDLIWAEMQATDPEGYRADRPIVVFAGTSAGGFGVAYNYHWVLDDLGWVNTTVVPDAALSMDNGFAGVIALGSLVTQPASPGWNVRPFLPPYCNGPECMEIFGVLELASAPRLLGTPYQRFLQISNQVDNTQRSTTLFPSMVAFINTAREHYCALRGTPGLHAFLRGTSSSVHGEITTSTWNSTVVGGTLLRDWVGGAMADPASVVDKVEEGTLITDFPGVQPFPCDIGS